jgi:hypothetical protein
MVGRDDGAFRVVVSLESLRGRARLDEPVRLPEPDT